MTKNRLDKELARRELVRTRSEAESWIKLGKVYVNGQVLTKSGTFVSENATIELKAKERYVSRAGLKLASIAREFGLRFADTVVLDVGSSTGGFTDYALQNGARLVYAVDVGTDQLHESLRSDNRIELHEKTDIRTVFYKDAPRSLTDTVNENTILLDHKPEYIVIDVSFISLRDILPHIFRHIAGTTTQIVAMVKPQFEAGRSERHKGVIKNDTMRRKILSDFESWVKQYALIRDKRDSDVAGAGGNRERFYLLQGIYKNTI